VVRVDKPPALVRLAPAQEETMTARSFAAARLALLVASAALADATPVPS